MQLQTTDHIVKRDERFNARNGTRTYTTFHLFLSNLNVACNSIDLKLIQHLKLNTIGIKMCYYSFKIYSNKFNLLNARNFCQKSFCL